MPMKDLKYNIYIKIGSIIALVLILLIPTSMVKDLVRERAMRQRTAIDEVGDKWGSSQTLTGPFISVPYDKYMVQINPKDSSEQTVKIKEWIHYLPNDLRIKGNLLPEELNRGIYEVVVYDAALEFMGDFPVLPLHKFDINPDHVHYDKAIFNIGITDLKGIEEQIALSFHNNQVDFNAGLSDKDIVSTGIHAPIHLNRSDSGNYKFRFKLSLKGSQDMYFTPLGKTTDIRLQSNWPTPSFSGNTIPDEREVSDNGFMAHWNVLHLNRNYPQQWLNGQHGISSSKFGVDLLLPVDRYKKTNRVAKYAILFLALTFLVFFFVEVLNGVFVHPMQYLLVGVALVVFYSLLLAFSEHMLFDYAYIIATSLTLLLIALYARSVLKSNALAVLVGGILLIMYTFIFAIIQLQDYALLIGSLGVFIILALVMYFSRKIDWYQIKLGPKTT